MVKHKIITFTFGSLFSTYILSSAIIGPSFNQEIEFPNYFIPKNFSSLTPDQKTAILSQRRALLENALRSVTDRLVVPLVPEGGSEVKLTRYFDYIEASVKSVDPTAKVMPSGGVVRSILSHLYEEIQDEVEKNPKLDPAAVLKRIAVEKSDIPAIDVRGVGGDFDLLVEAAEGKLQEVQEKVLTITNSAETVMGARNNNHSVKRVLFTVGDVKDYRGQIARSTGQGGSTIDFLAFDRRAGKFVEPPHHPYIIDDFLQGFYRYLPPQNVDAAEDTQKQLIRGIRPMLELPFIRLKDEAQFRKEMEILLNGELKSSKAFEQIGKSIRNGRRSLGNNRIVRGADGSVERLIRNLSEKLKRAGLPHIPEYGEHSSISLRDPKNKTELKGFPIELLMSYETFAKGYSENGVVTHGTPTLDDAMAILRGGFFYSGGFYNQGGSGEGSGVYAARSAKSAKDGIQLSLQIKNDPRINIIHWERAQFHPFLIDAEKKAAKLRLQLNQYLQRYHGIDIIVKNAVLIQNIDAIHLGTVSERVTILLEGLKKEILTESDEIEYRLDRLTNFINLSNYARSVGIPYQGINLQEETNKVVESGIYNLIHKHFSSIDENFDALLTFERALYRLRNSGLETREIPKTYTDSLWRRFVNEASYSRLANYMDEITKKERWPLLKKRIATDLKSSSSLSDLKGQMTELRAEIAKKQPMLSTIRTLFLGERTIIDPDLRTRFVELEKKIKHQEGLDSFMERLHNMDAPMAKKHFPAYQFSTPNRPEWHYDQGTKKYTGSNYLGRRYAELFSKLDQDPSVFSKIDQDLIQAAVNRTYVKELALLLKNPLAQPEIENEIKKPENARSVKSFLVGFNSDDGRTIKTFLFQELESDEAFRSQIRPLFLENVEDQFPLQGFPWDIKRPLEKGHILNIVEKRDAILKEERFLKHLVFEKFGMVYEPNSFQYNWELKNRIDRSLYVRLLKNSKNVRMLDMAENILGGWSKQADERELRDFEGHSADLDRQLEAVYNNRAKSQASEILANLRTTVENAEGLPTGIQEKVLAHLGKPLVDRETMHLWAEIAQLGPAFDDLILKRLQKLQASDVTHFIPGVVKEIKGIESARLYRRYSKDWRTGIQKLFDLENEEDRIYLRKALELYPESSEELNKEISKLWDEARRQSQKVIYYTYEIYDEKIRTRLDLLFEKKIARDQIENIFRKFQDEIGPGARKIFPDYRFPTLGHQYFGDALKQNDKGIWEGKYFLGKWLAKLLNPPMAQLANNIHFNLESQDLEILRELLRQNNWKKELGLLAQRPAYLRTMLGELKGVGLEDQVIAHLPQFNRNQGTAIGLALLDELEKDPEFKNRVRRRVAADARSFRELEFPWQSNDQKDLKFLRAGLAAEEGVKKEIKKITQVLLENHHIIYHDGTFYTDHKGKERKVIPWEQRGKIPQDSYQRLMILGMKLQRIDGIWTQVKKLIEKKGESVAKDFRNLSSEVDKNIDMALDRHYEITVTKPLLANYRDFISEIGRSKFSEKPLELISRLNLLMNEKLDSLAKMNLWEALGRADPAFVQPLFVRRLKNLRSGDKPELAAELFYQWLRSSSHHPHHGEMSRLYRRYAGDTAQIHYLIFDSNRQEDIGYLKEYLSRYPRPESEISAEIKLLREKAARAFPVSFQYLENNFKAENFLVGEDLIKYQKLVEEYNARSSVEEKMLQLHREQSDIMEREFPAYKFPANLPQYSNSTNGVWKAANFLARRYDHLLRRQASGEFLNGLDSEVQSWLRDLVRKNYLKVGGPLLKFLEIPEFSLIVWEELKKESSNTANLILTLIADNKFKPAIFAELDRDTKFRKRVLSLVINNPDNMREFPWNLDRALERRFLESSARAAEGALEQWDKKNLELLEKYGIYVEGENYQYVHENDRYNFGRNSYFEKITDKTEAIQVEQLLLKNKRIKESLEISRRLLKAAGYSLSESPKCRELLELLRNVPKNH